jgi:hypothetical protein
MFEKASISGPPVKRASATLPSFSLGSLSTGFRVTTQEKAALEKHPLTKEVEDPSFAFLKNVHSLESELDTNFSLNKAPVSTIQKMALKRTGVFNLY